jgi:hypothetical protein
MPLLRRRVAVRRDARASGDHDWFDDRKLCIDNRVIG